VGTYAQKEVSDGFFTFCLVLLTRSPGAGSGLLAPTEDGMHASCQGKCHCGVYVVKGHFYHLQASLGICATAFCDCSRDCAVKCHRHFKLLASYVYDQKLADRTL
jgi:hypothetical protein